MPAIEANEAQPNNLLRTNQEIQKAYQGQGMQGLQAKNNKESMDEYAGNHSNHQDRGNDTNA